GDAQETRQGVPGEQERQRRGRRDDDVGLHPAAQSVDDCRHGSGGRDGLIEHLPGHGRTAVQIGYAQDPLPIDAGVPGTTEAHVDAAAAPTDFGAEEPVPVRVRVVRVRSNRDDLMTDSAQVVDEDPPSPLRGADLRIVVVAEQDDSHAWTTSAELRLRSHSGKRAYRASSTAQKTWDG